MNDKLLEPLKYYKEELQEQHQRNIESFFDDLVVKSNVNVEANRETVRKYKNKLSEIEAFAKHLKKYGIFKTLIIVCICLCGVGLIYSIYKLFNDKANVTTYSLIAGGAIILVVIVVFILIKFIDPSIKDDKAEKSKLESMAASLQDEGYNQLLALNRLFDSDHTRQLVMKTMPDVILDKYFAMERFEYLNGKYGLDDNNDINNSSLAVMTGEIVGNPYVITKSLSHYLGDYKYTGELTIHWETYTTDSNGNRQTIHHSETLHASVTKPKPYYSNTTTMIYGNEAAPNLSFSRKAGHAEKMSDKEVERYIKKSASKLGKLAENSIKNGGTFTELGNDEFDVLFGAFNRDNEAEFRLLFTPLAQRNEVDLIRNSPYGDDFEFVKDKKINYVTSENSLAWDMDTSGFRFYNFDIDDAKEKFKQFETQYFDHLYFLVAPILAIPLYQQHKPREYIYKHDYKRNYTSYETEALANILGDQRFAHPSSKTPAIIKTKHNNMDGKTDSVSVTAYSYDAQNRTTYVPVYGGDGYYHDVRVDWVEYIPLKASSSMKLKDINVRDDEFDVMRQRNEFKNFISSHKVGGYGFKNGIFAMQVDNDKINLGVDEEINQLLKAIMK